MRLWGSALLLGAGLLLVFVAGGALGTVAGALLLLAGGVSFVKRATRSDAWRERHRHPFHS